VIKLKVGDRVQVINESLSHYLRTGVVVRVSDYRFRGGTMAIADIEFDDDLSIHVTDDYRKDSFYTTSLIKTESKKQKGGFAKFVSQTQSLRSSLDG
jgi:hypothetical protein